MVPTKTLAAIAIAALELIFPAGAAPSGERAALQRLSEEVEIVSALQALDGSAPRGLVAIRNIQIVDPATEEVTPGQAVISDLNSNGLILWVGDAAKMPARADLTVIDGGGRYLAPGLVDMHVHADSMSGWLLDLANGVTGVRDMDGFPWILAVRQSVNAGRMLAPALHVTGTIINALPMDGYAVVPKDSADARRIVRQEAACGYDFIKIHNLLPPPMMTAVIEQAHLLGMDVVGHIPHDSDLGYALHNMRTTEHLKGFIIDQTLLPSDDDFKKALAGAETWLTPTLYTRVGYDRGDEARAVLAGPAARYVAPSTRAEWRQLLAQGADDQTRTLGSRLRASQDDVMRRLLPLKPKWLAGTDAAGYPFNIMGFALIDELRLLQGEGLSAAEALRAATTEPARAMRVEAEVGKIARGGRADFVLLDKNPLEDPSVYASNVGVMAGGKWLSRKDMNAALEKLAAIYADKPAGAGADAMSDLHLVDRVESAAKAGYVFSTGALIEAAKAYESSGRPLEAERLKSVAGIAESQTCKLETPAR